MRALARETQALKIGIQVDFSDRHNFRWYILLRILYLLVSWKFKHSKNVLYVCNRLEAKWGFRDAKHKVASIYNGHRQGNVFCQRPENVRYAIFAPS